MNLTIKHVSSDGTEQVLMCGSFFAERMQDGRSVSFCAYKGTHRGTDLLNIWSGDIRHSPHDNRAAIYVVNDKGATVSIHRYDDSAFLTPPPPPLEIPDPQLNLPLDIVDAPVQSA